MNAENQPHLDNFLLFASELIKNKYVLDNLSLTLSLTLSLKRPLLNLDEGQVCQCVDPYNHPKGLPVNSMAVLLFHINFLYSPNRQA